MPRPDKSLSKAAKKKYVSGGGVSRVGCPFCGERPDSYKIEYDEFITIESGDIEQEIACRECKRQWKDVFRLVEMHELCSKS